MELSALADAARHASADEQLVRECLDGSQDAWSALIDKYRNLVFSIPIRQGFTQDETCEIFQQVCMKLVSELSRIRDVQSLAGWLIRVTTRECLHWKRRSSRHAAVEGSDDAETASPGGTAEKMLAEIQREQTLREAVAALASRCRQLISLLFFTAPQVSYGEIAKELAVAKGSVGFIRMRCLERLRKDLEEKGFR